MASQFDAIRQRDRRQQGQEARERVRQRLQNPVQSPAESTSMFDAVRNRTITVDEPAPLDPEKGDHPMSDLIQKYGAASPLNSIQNLTKAQAPAAQVEAPKSPRDIEYNERRQERESMPAPVRAFGNTLDDFFYKTNVGNFLSRIGHSADSIMSGGNPVTAQPDTGSKVANKVADITGGVASVFTPTGAPSGAGPIAGTYGVTDKVLTSPAGQKLEQAAANQLGKVFKNPQTAQAITREALRETAAGTMQGAAFGAMTGEDDKGILTSAVTGGAIGGATGAAFKGVELGLAKLFKRNGIPQAEIDEILALPEGKKDTRMTAAAERGNLAASTEPIANPYTFELPEASPSTVRASANAAEGRSGLKEIDQAINDLQTSYEQRVIDEYKFLKESRDSRGGVQQGNIQRNQSGDVIGRSGRQSNNPLWYQEFYAKNGKVPSNKDLYQLARERVDNGFVDEAGAVPSWRDQNGYDEQLAGLAAVRENLQNSLREIDPALHITDQPIISQELKDARVEPSGVRRATPSPAQPVKPGTSKLDPRRQEINERLSSGGNLSPEDIDYILASEAAPAAERTIKPPDPPKIDPNADPILRPGQFADNNGLGISAFSKTNPYDSLSNTTRSQLVTRLDKEPVSFAGVADRLYTNLVDDLHPLNQFDKLVKDVLDKPLSAAHSVHKLALATRGSDMTARQIITDALVDSNGQVIGESLKDILSGLPKAVRGEVNSSTKSQIRKVSKDIYVDFEDYLINKHAITRAERGETVFDKKLNWTPEYGAQKVAEYEKLFPEFKETADKLYNFNRQMVNSWLVDTGVISPEMAQAWFDANPYYVPNKRYFTPLEKRNNGVSRAKKGFGNQSNPVKSYEKTGSQRKIISPIEAIIENTDAFVKTAKRNQVMQQAVKNIEADPEAFVDFFEIVKKPERLEDLTKLPLDGNGLDEVLSRFSDDFDKAMQKTALDKDNIVRVMNNGEQIHLKVNDPQLLDAITALGPKSSNYVMDAVGWLTNKMKTLTTGANPVFSFTRNILRDIPHAYVASKTTNNPIRFIADMAEASVQIMRDGELYKQYKRVGGGHSSSIAANRNLLAQSKRSVLPKSLLKDLGPRLYYGLENVMNAVESAPRLAEFKRASKGGLPDDLKKALFEAQDITVNFKRRGKIVADLDKVFPYMNAAIQGFDQVVRLYKNNPVQATIKAFLAFTVPSVVLYAVNYNDPNYKKLSNRTKDNFLLVPKGDGTFIKIAKPMELGTLFSDLPERLMRKFAEDDPAAFRDFADQLRTKFLPPGISGAAKGGGITDRMLGVVGDTILGPFADLAANETFSGAPIVPGHLKNLSPGLQADTKTTNIAKWIGDKTYGTPFEQSPKKLDYLVKQYTGFIGQFGQPLLAPGGDLGSALAQQVTADPVFSNDISTEFYHFKDKIDQAYNDREIKELPEWYSDPLRKQLNKINQNMSKVRMEIRVVQEDTSISNKEKRTRLRELQDKLNNMAEKGNTIARNKIPY
ncbi:LPD38 domain-containing protein [Paenibacillus motobuensis]|uniref:Large polyvalent protein associated domain-containing protein n=1 Tax=Paenibacillus motobuensis TaxID=295324 RepID=A0ABN0Y487_9BACL